MLSPQRDFVYRDGCAVDAEAILKRRRKAIGLTIVPGTPWPSTDGSSMIVEYIEG